MAADRGDINTLAAKLRGKGASPAQVAEGLRGLGYSKAEAEAAAGIAAKPAPTPSPAPQKPTAGQQSSTGTDPAPAPVGGVGVPQLPDLSGMTLTPPKRLRADDLGGFFAGLAVYALVLSYIRFGPAGPGAWMRAKFLNQPDESMREEESAARAKAGADEARKTANELGLDAPEWGSINVGGVEIPYGYLPDTKPAAPRPVQ